MATGQKLPAPERPKAGAKKQDWVNYLAANGVSVEVARSMTLPQLQSWQPGTPTSADVKAQAPQQDPVQDEAVTVEAGGPPNAPEPDWSEAMRGAPGVMTIEEWERDNPPSVHESWCRVMESVRSVAKGDYNKDQRFHFRGIDAVLDAVGPALRAHTVHVRPRRIISTTATEYTSKGGSRMVNRLVHVEWEVTGPQGDSFLGESMGEAADSSDKSMSKAQSVAYRVFLLQALSIPTGDDPDFETHERATPSEREQAQRQAQSSGSYRSREEWEAAQRQKQAQAGEENQDRWPESSNVDPWTGAKDEAQQPTSTVGQPDSRENPKQDADNKPQAAQQDARAAEARKELWRVAKELGWQWANLSNRFKSDYGIETAAATEQQLEEFKVQIIGESDDMERAKTLAQNELGAREVDPNGSLL
jgi:hypothetical protein